MADDIMTRLRNIINFPPDVDIDWRDAVADALDEIERLQAIVTTVDDLHSPRLAHDTCLACDHNWPCPTHLLIHPEEARRG